MGIKTSKHHLLVAAAFVLAFGAAGCVSEDETTGPVVRDAAFLGYSNPDTKQTTCGNCHTDIQAQWSQTGHANAWADLQASGHAGPTCEKCHTVSGRTNGGGQTTGFFAVSEDAKQFYQDVQCESCHGPGANHVSAPGETQPIPTYLAENTTYADGCTACHNGTHHPFAEQLAASRHGQMPYWETRGCQVPCHQGSAALTVYNPRFQYRDHPGNPASDTTFWKTRGHEGLSCSVCHDPHDASGGSAQLRFDGVEPSETDSGATHVCGKCHNRGAVATASSWRSSRGAHSGQWANLMGYGGYDWGMVGARGPARHGTMEGTCATCHMHNQTVNNTAGQFAVQNVGHTWTVVPCLNPTMTATGGVDTANACAESERDFSACATSNCHGSQESARRAMEHTQNEIKSYVYLLWADLDHDDSIDPFPTDTGWIPRVLRNDANRPAGSKRLATSGADTVFTVAKGARFNVLTFGHPIGHADGSWGVHNPGYIRTVMAETVRQMRAAYAVSDTLVGVPPAMQAMLDRSPRR